MAAPTFLGSGIRNNNGAAGTTASYTLNIPAGTELIVFSVDHWEQNRTVTGVTIGSGGTQKSATQLGTQVGTAGGTQQGGFCGYVEDPETGSSVAALVTFSGSQSAFRVLHYFCFGDVPDVSGDDPFDDFQDWAQADQTTHSFSLTTTQDNDFLIAFIHEFDDATHGSISGFTENQINGTSGGIIDYSESWYLEDAGTAGAESFSWSQGASRNATTFAVAIKGLNQQTVAVGLASETDTAQAIDHSRTLAAGLASETDSAQSMVAARVVAIALASETDSAQAIDHSLARAIGLASEADSAIALTARRLVDIGLASETDSALSIAGSKSAAAGLASEIDSALSISIRRELAIGLASETDTAQDVSATGPGSVDVGLASETDSALAITARKELAIDLAEETDSALSAIAARLEAVGLATETDSALAATFRRELAIEIAAETDSALGVTLVGGAAVATTRDTGGGAGGSAKVQAEMEEWQRRRRIEEEEVILSLLLEDAD